MQSLLRLNQAIKLSHKSMTYIPCRFLRGSMNNFYETLGVSHKSTFEEIDHVYKLQVKHYNPDYGISLDDITLAYKTLINPKSREEYDLYIS